MDREIYNDNKMIVLISQPVRRVTESDGRELFSPKRLREIRRKKDWSMPKLAEKTKEADPHGVGLSQSSIAAIETDRSNPTIHKLRLIGRALGVEWIIA